MLFIFFKAKMQILNYIFFILFVSLSVNTIINIKQKLRFKYNVLKVNKLETTGLKIFFNF